MKINSGGKFSVRHALVSGRTGTAHSKKNPSSIFEEGIKRQQETLDIIEQQAILAAKERRN